MALRRTYRISFIIYFLYLTKLYDLVVPNRGEKLGVLRVREHPLTAKSLLKLFVTGANFINPSGFS